MNLRTSLTLLAVMSATVAAQQGALKYPEARKSSQVDDFYGTKIADPYRWLEDSDSTETRAWIDAENKVTFGYLESIPERPKLLARLKQLQDYERYGVPRTRGAALHLQPEHGPAAAVRHLHVDVPLAAARGAHRSERAVSERHNRHRRDLVHRGRPLPGLLPLRERLGLAGVARPGRRDGPGICPDVIKWSKFSGATWLKDGTGFYYEPVRRAEGRQPAAVGQQEPEGVLPQARHRRRPPTRSSTNVRTSRTGALAPR